MPRCPRRRYDACSPQSTAQACSEEEIGFIRTIFYAPLIDAAAPAGLTEDSFYIVEISYSFYIVEIVMIDYPRLFFLFQFQMRIVRAGSPSQSRNCCNMICKQRAGRGLR